MTIAEPFPKPARSRQAAEAQIIGQAVPERLPARRQQAQLAGATCQWASVYWDARRIEVENHEDHEEHEMANYR